MTSLPAFYAPTYAASGSAAPAAAVPSSSATAPPLDSVLLGSACLARQEDLPSHQISDQASRGRGRVRERERGRGRGRGRRGGYGSGNGSRSNNAEAFLESTRRGWRCVDEPSPTFCVEPEFAKELISERARFYCLSVFERLRVELDARALPDGKIA
jgi:hypothetical protein